MREFVYPARVSADRREGGFVVTFRDVPEAITQGESLQDAFEAAAGALQAALEGRILDDLDIPRASRAAAGEYAIPVPILTALKTALVVELRQAGVTRVELARQLGVDEKEVRRMLDPYHSTKAERLEKALAVFGRQVKLRVA